MFIESKKSLWLFAMIAILFAGIVNPAFASSGHGDDPAMANASSEIGNPLQFKTDFSIFTLAVFIVLLIVLYSVAWKPLREGLDRREKMISDQIEGAKQAALRAEEKLKEYEAKLAEAAIQAQETVVQARKDAESVAARIKSDAQGEASRLLDRAKSEIETAKQAAISELATKSTDIAFGLARRVIGRELKQDDHKQLISDAIGRISNNN